MTTTPTGGYSYGYQPQIDFNWLARGWDLFRARPWFWVGVTFLFGVIYAIFAIPVALVTGYSRVFMASLAPLFHPGALPAAPPNFLMYYGSSFLFSLIVYTLLYVLLAGFYGLALRQVRGEALTVGGLFDGFRQLPALLVAGFIVYLCVTIGSYLCVLPGLVLGGLFMFVPLLIMDRKLGPIQALTQSVELLKSQWIMAAVFYFVVSLIAGLGAIVCLVGVLVSLPLLFLSVAVGYSAMTQPPMPPQMPGYGPSTPGVWPPPPSVGPN
jgi:hypothetical protein